MDTDAKTAKTPSARSRTDRNRWIISAIVSLLLGILAVAAFRWAGRASGCHSREDAEINALSAALESYKADHDNYPRNEATDSLRTDRDFNPQAYIPASKFLYRRLSGVEDGTVYFEFSKTMLKTDSDGQPYIVDLRGNSYGYSTASVRNGPEFYDLWSTSGGTRQKDVPRWLTNW